MHAGRFDQFRQSGVRDLPRDQRVRNYTRDLAASGSAAFASAPISPTSRATVDQSPAMTGDGCTQRFALLEEKSDPRHCWRRRRRTRCESVLYGEGVIRIDLGGAARFGRNSFQLSEMCIVFAFGVWIAGGDTLEKRSSRRDASP